MAYIYQIQNDINNKIYVGKTEFSIEKRWKEHCRDYKKESKEKRPLYLAMNKYGIEHFHISLLEETDNPEERECYWIEKLGSFKYGYNATTGGDGRKYLDYDLILALWNEGLCIKEISNITNYSSDQISSILEQKEVSLKERQQRGWEKISKVIACIDKETDKIIKVFSSIESAHKELKVRSSGHISAVCNGKRKTAYGYKWKYL